MMRLSLSWQRINAVLMFLAVAVLSITALPTWHNTVAALLDATLPLPAAVRNASEGKSPTAEKVASNAELFGLERARKVRLRRMNSPVAVAKETPKAPEPVVPATPPPPIPVTLYSGRLFGTILDKYPEYQFAIFQSSDGKMILVRKGDTIPGTSPIVTLEEVNAGEAILVSGPNRQTIEVSKGTP